MGSLAHWSLALWVAPAAALALWTAWVVHPGLMSTPRMNPVWLVVLGAGLASPVAAAGYWLTHLKDGRAALAAAVNAGGLAVNGLGLVLAAGHAGG